MLSMQLTYPKRMDQMDDEKMKKPVMEKEKKVIAISNTVYCLCLFERYDLREDNTREMNG